MMGYRAPVQVQRHSVLPLEESPTQDPVTPKAESAASVSVKFNNGDSSFNPTFLHGKIKINFLIYGLITVSTDLVSTRPYPKT